MVEGRGAGHNFLYVSILMPLDGVVLMCFVWAVLSIVADHGGLSLLKKIISIKR